MVVVIVSTGTVFTFVSAQVKALWRKGQEVMSGVNERSLLWCMIFITTYSWDQLSSERLNALRPFAVSNL